MICCYFYCSLTSFSFVECQNFDLDSIVTPVDVDAYHKLLVECGYNKTETDFLVSSFRDGFSLGYEGEILIQRYSPNLKLECRTEVDLWEKMMKEVKLKRFVGPFEEVPFENFIIKYY